ncbi:relaxase MobL [Dysosmobacter sp.]|uniref:relaxase MobL n=1 Tax=Dysosmobacter sp. TaxID=2591382 RepID=UPI002A81FCC4|nr:relaxase MobL [Dysosmobacter sp.]MDY3652545.1 relaxase MobL [Dysosmobacter sp.]
MARLIVKSPYIKCGGGNSAGGYMRYIATRERVELIQDDRPPTRKQEQLIVKLVAHDARLYESPVPQVRDTIPEG